MLSPLCAGDPLPGLRRSGRQPAEDPPQERRRAGGDVLHLQHVSQPRVSGFPTRVRVSILIAHGRDACDWLLATFYADGAATDPAWRKERDATLAASTATRLEDDHVCEAVQQARRSPVFRKRFYSPFWENMTYTFNRRILDELEKG
jgi:Ring hydroxylating alpha subunit (catalytic domain)